jgi:hypothetical protein
LRKFKEAYEKNSRINLLDFSASQGVKSTQLLAQPFHTQEGSEAQRIADKKMQTVAFGDDKSDDLIKTGKIDGNEETSKSGLNVDGVLSLLEDYQNKSKKNKNFRPLNTKIIYLSTGLENTPEINDDDYETVQKQITILNSLGAGQIKILGVSAEKKGSENINNRLFSLSSMNRKLQFIPIGAKNKLTKSVIQDITDFRPPDEIQADFEKKNMRVTGENIKETQLITESKNIITPYEYDASVYGEDNSLGESMRKSMSPNDTQGLVPPGPALIGRIESPFNPIQKQFASYGSLTLITIG